MPFHSSRHIENLQEISCCFKMWDLVITSTMYTSTASSKLFQACFVYLQAGFWVHSYANVHVLITLLCYISRNVWTHAFINNVYFPLQTLINSSRTSPCTPAEYSNVSWWLSTSICIYSHPIACCIRLELYPVVWAINICLSWVVLSVVDLLASWGTGCCLHCCCVSWGGT